VAAAATAGDNLAVVRSVKQKQKNKIMKKKDGKQTRKKEGKKERKIMEI